MHIYNNVITNKDSKWRRSINKIFLLTWRTALFTKLSSPIIT